jgi:hypothetical protein
MRQARLYKSSRITLLGYLVSQSEYSLLNPYFSTDMSSVSHIFRWGFLDTGLLNRPLFSTQNPPSNTESNILETTSDADAECHTKTCDKSVEGFLSILENNSVLHVYPKSTVETTNQS